MGNGTLCINAGYGFRLFSLVRLDADHDDLEGFITPFLSISSITLFTSSTAFGFVRTVWLPRYLPRV